MPEQKSFRSLVEQIRESNDIVEVISEHVALDRSHKALCPFHEEKTPSFHVNPQSQHFKCFGCGVGGDVFKFIELRERLPFMEALRRLASRAGISLADISHNELLHAKETRHVEEVLAASAHYYHSRLAPEARAYLNKRGVTDETIKRFKIGYAPGGLLEHLTSEKGFPIESCLFAGVVRKTNGGKAADYFSDRLIFPNIVRGRVVHLSGRALLDAQPKYLHLPGGIRFFFNEDALRSPRVILVEGILDCLPVIQAGFACAALYGTSAFKESHLPRLAWPEVVYLSLDADNAGRAAALRIADLIGEKARIVELPAGTDPGDYFLGHSPDDFQRLLDSALDLIAFELRRIPEDTPKTELPRLLKPILMRLARLESSQAQAYLQYAIKERFKLRKEDVDAYRTTVKSYRDNTEADLSDKAGAGSPASFIWDDYQPFNPAQDFRAGKAYFTVYLQRRPREGGPLIRQPYIITGSREMFPLTQAELDARALRLQRAEQIPSDTSRWATSPDAKNSVHSFINGEASIDPVALFERIRALFNKYLDYPEPLYYDFISLWCIGTYLFMGFESYPYIYLSGTKRTGKTRTIEIASSICFNSVMSASMSDAAMYRSTENDRCTIFHDEAAKYSRKNKNDLSERLEIFNSGYKRSGSVRRCVGDDSTPTDFSTYSPKLLANIEGLDQTSADRTITLHLLRAKGEVPKFSYRREEGAFQETRNGLYVLALKYHAEIFKIYSGQEMVPGLKDREDELWGPIFTLAEFIDGYRLARDPGIAEAVLLSSKMIRLAFTCRDRKQEDDIEENPDQRILAALLDFLDENDPILDHEGQLTEFHPSDAVLAYINERDGLDWVTKHYLGKALSKLQILKEKKNDRPYLRMEGRRLTRLGKKVLCYRLLPDRVNDVAERYAIRGVGSILEAEKILP